MFRSFTAIVILTSILAPWRESFAGNSSGDSKAKRVAILYFDNSGDDPKLEKLKKGLASMLITDLSRVASLSIIEREKLEEIIKEQKLSNSKAVDDKTAAQLGKLLGVETILTGSFFELMGTLRIDARFIDVETGKILKSDGVEGPLTNFFGLEKSLLNKIITNLEVKLSDDEKAFIDLQEKGQRISYEDASLYSEALDQMDLGQKESAIEKLNAVLKKNPGFDPAVQTLKKIKSADTAATVQPAEKGADTLMRGTADPMKGLNINKTPSEMQFGNYYALLIGIDNYTGTWTKLNNAVNDAKAIGELLRTKYKFDKFNSLYNEEATRSNIMKQMEWLVNNVKENDNVFIYYSGHGQFKKSLNKGYWVPCDAKTDEVSEFISNSDIQTFLSSIKSKHTLLVSDACFSGDIFRGNTVSVPFEASDKYYLKVHEKPSRKAITSGGIEPVMDGGKDNHSVFAYYFLKALKTNESKYFDSTQLFEGLKIAVINNSQQTPAFNPIKDSGDEGGQFIFIKK